ncbi:MAG: aminomethyl-transferring glycine dehydrogenase subunit GcvPB [Planctomycetes bacterium]|nr:aminomethyl-transferring glycine dehydrogenase subunit GcvPB [Planctomycetota bacterium]
MDTNGWARRTIPTLFERSRSGANDGSHVPPADGPAPAALLGDDADLLADAPPPLPEVGEAEVVRHYTHLAARNMSVDANFYPLGSCTMKYNPRINEWAASRDGLAALHPLAPAATAQGALRLLHELETYLARIAGLDAVTLTPAAGAHGELTALKVITAYYHSRGEGRSKVLTPDSAHGTNPASCTVCGRLAVPIASRGDGRIDLDDLRAKLDDQTAALMITNPNTLGLFETDIADAAELVHAAGAQLYLDGANMNAILGITRPGDFGVDAMHFNLHKTFSTPHGGGGPGAGPVAVASHLEPFLPTPRVVHREGAYRLLWEAPQSIGPMRSFAGQFAVCVRAWCYIRALGGEGLRRASETAVLAANYLAAKLKTVLPLPHDERCMHEFVLTASRRGASDRGLAGRIAKRLLDYGFHAPTVYFPLIVEEALMIEPTETESLATLDAFVAAMREIVAALDEDPHALDDAPRARSVARVDETAAARQPVLRWRPRM